MNERALIAAGADPNAPQEGTHYAETPLHWVASSDDVEAFDVLIKAGADIEAPGGSIGGGTPLDNAVGYGQWQVARRLVACGARTKLWHAAALGLMSRVEAYVAGNPPPSRDQISEALPIALLAASIGVRLFYIQHQFEDTFWAPDKTWSLHEAALHGSSHYDRPVVVHGQHRHAPCPSCSRISCYRLPQVLRDYPELNVVGRLTLTKSLGCVRLVLWDESRQQLISLREMRQRA